MKTRLKDIAEHLKLSPALVSGVLNQRDNVWASVETRARVFQAARDLKYGDFEPSVQDRKPEEELSVILLGGWREGFGPLVGALTRESTISVSSPKSVSEALRWVSANIGRSLIVTGPAALRELFVKDLNGSFVVIADEPKEGEFGFDLHSMAAGAVDHLRALGHRQIAYLGDGDSGFYDGFAAWMKTALRSEGVRVDVSATALESALNAENPPTGWVVGGDSGSWALLETCLALRGRQLGFSSEEPAASGLHDGRPLSLGSALVYDIEAGTDRLACLALASLRGNSVSRKLLLRLTRASGNPKISLIDPSELALELSSTIHRDDVVRHSS